MFGFEEASLRCAAAFDGFWESVVVERVLGVAGMRERERGA